MLTICVLPYGFVLIGYLAGDVLSKAKVIRNWGTTKGIGELVNGPTSSTILDDLPTPVTLRTPPLFTFPVNEDRWHMN